jgi:Poxvirus A22 protein/Mitochondrial resolvase Ydc2 / RNA splicing MRS1
MKIMSIDVGIKNLSFCLFEHNIENFSIVKWDVVNLLEKDTSVCCIPNCKNEPKYIKQNNIYCSKHAKKTEFLVPTKELNSSFLKKQKLENLFIIADKLCIENTKSLKKKDLLGVLLEFLENHCLDSIYKKNCNKIDLVEVGKNIKYKLDLIIDEVDVVIIENQISPIASRMKTIQGMIAQYFIMKNDKIDIQFISATNKLKSFLDEETTKYSQRKKLSIEKCREYLETNKLNDWISFFKTHKKKDDLSDCFLQGLWYIENKLN